MSDETAILQARSIVRKMNALRGEVENLTRYARTLRSMTGTGVDARDLMGLADKLLQHLKASRTEFEHAGAATRSLTRSLSSRAGAPGVIPPAAQWGNEFRAGVKQFETAVRGAEKEILRLYAASNAQINSPLRYSTDPSDVVDVVLTLADLLAKLVEFLKRKK